MTPDDENTPPQPGTATITSDRDPTSQTVSSPTGKLAEALKRGTAEGDPRKLRYGPGWMSERG